MAEAGAPEGLVVTAGYQTQGRGKPGNFWASPAGKNLLVSLLIRPAIQANEAPLLTQLACRSVAQVLKKYGIQAAFKRPNDLLVGGKKICGILVESSAKLNGSLYYAVIGIGLNVNAQGPELLETATSIKEQLGEDASLELLLNQLLHQLDNDLKALYAPAL